MRGLSSNARIKANAKPLPRSICARLEPGNEVQLAFDDRFFEGFDATGNPIKETVGHYEFWFAINEVKFQREHIIYRATVIYDEAVRLLIGRPFMVYFSEDAIQRIRPVGVK